MNEQNLIIEFIQAFDAILKNDSKGLNVKDTENKDLLAFAVQIGKIDFSVDSEISEVLKQQLLQKMKEQNINGELSDAELDCAAGGLEEFPEEDPKKK